MVATTATSAAMATEVVMVTRGDFEKAQSPTNRWLAGEFFGHSPTAEEALHEMVRRQHGWSPDYTFEVVIMKSAA